MRRILGRMMPRSFRPRVARIESTVRNAAVRFLAGRPEVDTFLPWRSYGVPESHIFFGYHDITPFDEEGTCLIAHRVAIGANPSRDPAHLIMIDRESGEMRTLGQTDLWSWQMGARLRWLQGGRIVWNTLVAPDIYGATMIEAQDGRTLAKLDTPLYDIDTEGRFGLSLDFSRLQRLRPGYGYSRCVDETASERCPMHAGVDRVCLADGGRERLVSLPDIAGLDPHPTMHGATHYLNHLSFSPNGALFCLLHLWLTDAGIRRSRLIVFDLSGAAVFHVPGQENVSHFDWTHDGKALLIFGRFPGDDASHYQILNLVSKKHKAVKGAPAVDGHPMFDPQRTTTGEGLPAFICDTYPDHASYRSLFHCETDKSPKLLGRFNSPPNLVGEQRCDLHPRWSPDGQAVAVDSAHNGQRSLVVLDCRTLEGAL